MDIDKQLKENIKYEILNLPEELIRAIENFKFRDIFNDIGKKYKFSEDEIKIIEVETILVLIGLVDPTLYSQNIENNVVTNEQIANEIYEEVKEKIFIPIYKNASIKSEKKYSGDKKLDERFSNLPKEVQDAIGQSDYQSKLYTISQNHKLNIEQTGILDEITTKVILNTIHPDQFENSLAD